MNKKVNYSIYFAASPMHLMCIYELQQLNPENNFQLIIFFGANDYANNQLFKTSTKLGFTSFITVHQNKNSIVGYISFLMLCAKLYKKFSSLNLNIIMIDFRNSFMHLLRCVFRNATFILIDDGFHTVVIYDKYLQNKIYLPVDNYKSIEGKITKWLFFGTDYKILKKQAILVFSIYFDYFASKKIIGTKNEFSSIRKLLGPNVPQLNKDVVFFIGTKNHERGLMSLEDELFYIEWLNNYWKLKGKKLFYVAKRSTSEKKISLIKNLNIDVFQFNLPLELALINNEFIPGTICATGSTLLKTLPMLYDSIDYYLVDVSAFYNFEADKNMFGIVKAFHSKQKIKLLPISR